MMIMSPPEPHYFDVQLPKTKLHVVRTGQGEPLLVVPATISYLDDWTDLIRFAGQRYESFFFELPGHGRSTPFPEPYRSDLVAESVEALLDTLGIAQVTLLGFSFGGILALKTLERLPERIKAVVLLAPCVGQQSLTYSLQKQKMLRLLVSHIHTPQAQQNLRRMIQHPVFLDLLMHVLIVWGKVDCAAALRMKLQQISSSTLDVLLYQISEILTLQFPPREAPFPQPCYLAMSVHDPLLDFYTIHDFLGQTFANLHTMRFTHRYHQPPHRLSLADYNEQYGYFLDMVPG
jgi:pimeloyl-ACP methyl ester carboxylesterase